MTRLAVLLAAALLAAAPAGAGPADAPATLNTDVTVETEFVRLGDLFAGLPSDVAEKPVAYAPELGRSAVLDAAWLGKIARRNGVEWRPSSRFQRVTVARASDVIPHEMVEDAIGEALRDAEPDRLMAVRFDSRRATLHVPVGSPISVDVRQLDYEPRTGRFTAHVAAPADDPVAEVRILGRAYEVVEVPVLTRRVARGEVIGKHDIAWAEVNARRLNSAVLLDPARMIGMTPRRLLQAGVPVRRMDVEEPVVVARGAMVTITVRTNHMTLTVRGQAMENGAAGRSIRVKNIRSQKVVEAVVVDAGTVAVEAPGAALSLN